MRDRQSGGFGLALTRTRVLEDSAIAEQGSTSQRESPAARPSPYRADVDGLRALAVVAVLLFHLRVPGFAGGFVGVDVFFVISGYLVTTMIASDLERGRFSFRGFCLRRLRRLAPAALLTITAVTAAAACLLYPQDMYSFAGSLCAQMLLLPNMFFLADGEYFRGADSKPLLHTWSLAIEEQFYLCWPLLLCSLRRARWRWQLVLAGVIITTSFAINVALFEVSPKASFFLLPARLWELASGGVLALLQLRRGLPRAWPSWLPVLGLLALVASTLCFSRTTPYPGWAALLPVTATLLLLLPPSHPARFPASVLAHPHIVRIGLLSYPIYLWHWPLLVFAHAMKVDVDHPVAIACIIACTLVLAQLTYEAVERPIRARRMLSSDRSLVAGVGIAAMGLVAVGVHLILSEGASYRYAPAAANMLTAPFHAERARCGLLFRTLHPATSVCRLAGPADAARRVLSWGNSHADMWSGLLRGLAQESGSALYLNARNCRPLPDSDFCGTKEQSSVMNFIRSERVTDVVLASSWYGAKALREDVFEYEMDLLVRRLAATGARTWLVIDIPVSAQLDPTLTFEKNPRAPTFGSVPLQEHLATQRRELSLFTRLAREHQRVYVIDPTLAFCDARGCAGGRDHESWYRDEGHLTNAGALVARQHFVPIFR